MIKINELFWERLKKIYSNDDIEIVKKWLNTKKRKVSFRINTLKSTDDEILSILKEKNIKYSSVIFLPNSYILKNDEEKVLWDLDIYKNWKIYIQSISSQIPPYFLDLKEGNIVLDVTAAPWSKTSQISAILWNTWKIIANELNQIRLEKLKFTCSRQWCENIEIVKNDAKNLWKKFEIGTFDAILADLPCSAEWRINLWNEKSFWFWSEENIKKNYKLQKEILISVIPLLKNGWVLVYSTCTLAPEENEWIVHFVLSNFKDLEIENIELDYKNIRRWITKFWDVVYNKNVSKSIRCLPSEETEGFFIAKFRKKEEI